MASYDMNDLTPVGAFESNATKQYGPVFINKAGKYCAHVGGKWHYADSIQELANVANLTIHQPVRVR
jgi:hypothetical protein